jgi:MFS family permease
VLARAPDGSWSTRLMAVMLVTQTSLMMARPATTYRAIEIGAGPWEIGLLTAMFGLLPAVVALRMGRLADRGGAGRILMVSFVPLAAGPVIVGFGDTFGWLALGTCLHGVGALAIMIAAQSIVAQRSAAAGLDRAFGHLTAFISLGQMLGPLLGGLVVAVLPIDGRMRWVCVLSAVLCLLCLPAVIGLGGSGFVARDRGAHESVGLLAIIRRPGVFGGMLSSIGLLTVLDVLVAFLPLLGQHRGLSPTVVGLLLSIRAAMSFASRLLLGRLRRTWGRVTLLVASTGLSGILISLVPVVDNVVVLAAALAAFGFLMGIGQPLSMSHLAQAVPANAVGAALSLRLTGNKVGQASIRSWSDWRRARGVSPPRSGSADCCSRVPPSAWRRRHARPRRDGAIARGPTAGAVPPAPILESEARGCR